MSETVVVYTASFGRRRDPMQEPRHYNPTCQWVYYSDDPAADSQYWEIRLVEPVLPPQRAAREIKILSHLFFPDADYWLWLDANIPTKVCPRSLIQEFLGVTDIAMHRHRDRDNLRDELQACLDQGKDDPDTMLRQVARYQENGYVERRNLAETGVILRRNTPEVRAFNEIWWKEVCAGSVRDQLSVSYALQKADVLYEALPDNSRASYLFDYVKHPNL